MKPTSWKMITTLGVWLAASILAASAMGATWGKAVAIGGHASDIALDEARGVLYIANFTANRIDVMSLADHTIQTSMNVSPLPGSLALSPDGRYLLVTHFGNFEPPATANNSLTVIDLETRGKQTFALSAPALGVSFGRSSQALVVTATDFTLFDPVSGTSRLLGTITEFAAQSLPVPPATFPPNVVETSLNVSGDGKMIYGLTNTFEFGYDISSGWLRILGYTSDPEQGPRVVSVNHDGSRYLAGWVLHGSALWDRAGGVWNLAQFPEAEGLLNVGSHAIDDSRGLVYAQFTTAGAGAGGDSEQQPPTLQIMNADNLAVIDRIQLPENLAGKSLLSADRNTLYSISDSGVMVLPIGELDRIPRLRANAEDLFFHTSFCERSVLTKEFYLHDMAGGSTDFSLAVNSPGVEVTPQNGTAPATITVRVNPTAFQNLNGTIAVEIGIISSAAVNYPKPVRVLVNSPEPDQRGTVVNVPGRLVDILADPIRDRFYILRQDTNQLLVFDGTTHAQIAALPTGNTPTQMAITFDRRYLLVGHDNSQYIAVYDIETLQPSRPIISPGGHYPRSVAASGNAILVANRNAGPVHTIDRVDMVTRKATELPSLGLYKNEIADQTVLVATPNGSSILAAQGDGNVLLYSASADTFTISRQDTEELSGPYAASSFDQFVIGNRLLNASLVTTAYLETASGVPSGFAFVDQFGFRTTAPSADDPGVIQRVDTRTGRGIRATRMVEAPVNGTKAFPFTRTLAALYSRQVLVGLTVSGFTVIPWDYDASAAPPRIGNIVNAADYTKPVAPGGLISIFGEHLSPVNQATSQIPLPTALGESCLSVNGVPTPMLFVSPQQINAQLPFGVDGNVTVVLHTPAGVSDNFNLTILPAAPSVFQRFAEANKGNVPVVVRYGNGQLVTEDNPIRGEDHIVIYLTGMGRTVPAIPEGEPAPGDPLATTLIPPDLHLAGVGLPVSYAGLAPGQVGVYQINAFVPWWVYKGRDMPLEINQGGQVTTVYVRVK